MGPRLPTTSRFTFQFDFCTRSPKKNGHRSFSSKSAEDAAAGAHGFHFSIFVVFPCLFLRRARVRTFPMSACVRAPLVFHFFRRQRRILEMQKKGIEACRGNPFQRMHAKKRNTEKEDRTEGKKARTKGKGKKHPTQN